jgi:uncharacterized membrane protein
MHGEESSGALGLSCLYAFVSFLGLPFFLRYFEANSVKTRLIVGFEKLIFIVSIAAISTKLEVLLEPRLLPSFLFFVYVMLFLFFSSALDASYRKIGIYSQEYYSRVFGEFPLKSEKQIFKMRVLIYAIPLMIIAASLFWGSISESG